MNVAKTKSVTAAGPLPWQDRVSMNSRIHPGTRQAVRELAAVTGYTQDQLNEIGIALLCGLTSPALKQARDACQAAITAKNIDLPADYLKQITR